MGGGGTFPPLSPVVESLISLAAPGSDERAGRRRNSWAEKSHGRRAISAGYNRQWGVVLSIIHPALLSCVSLTPPTRVYARECERPCM